jgi:hypothetical protein
MLLIILYLNMVTRYKAINLKTKTLVTTQLVTIGFNWGSLNHNGFSRSGVRHSVLVESEELSSFHKDGWRSAEGKAISDLMARATRTEERLEEQEFTRGERREFQVAVNPAFEFPERV